MRRELEVGWAETVVGRRNSLVRVDDRLLPRKVESHFPGVDGQPSLSMRLEVVDGVPQCRKLRLESTLGGSGVRDLDLAAIRLNQWIEVLFALFAVRVVSEDGGMITASPIDSDADQFAAMDAVQRARKKRGP